MSGCANNGPSERGKRADDPQRPRPPPPVQGRFFPVRRATAGPVIDRRREGAGGEGRGAREVRHGQGDGVSFQQILPELSLCAAEPRKNGDGVRLR